MSLYSRSLQVARRVFSNRARKIDGKAIADSVLEGVRADVAHLKSRNFNPGLAVIVVGERKDSLKYVQKKQDLAQSLGIRSEKVALPENCDDSTLRQTIENFNRDPKYSGILLQLPLPKHLSEKRALLHIDPAKDVDGFHPTNVGRLASWRESTLAPCTPRGVIHMLTESGVKLEGSIVAVIGESNVVGQPLILMLLAERATVIVVHKETPNPKELTRQADVVISAAGVARLVKPDWIKPGASVIDVGINFAPDPKRKNKIRMCGDVDPDVWDVASQCSPVPGGVGPMTVAMLMRNTIDAALMNLKWGEVGNIIGDSCQSTDLSLLDTDGDGTVSLEELKSALGDSAMSDAKLLELMSLADTDGDGQVTVEEARIAIENARNASNNTCEH